MRRYILFTEEELMKMVRGGELSHKISGTNETLYFMCSDYFLTDEEENDENNFDEVFSTSESFVFETEYAARFAISSLKHICDLYGMATLADWYDICGCDETNYLMNKEGWLETHLKDIKLEKVRDGYKVRLPQTFHID